MMLQRTRLLVTVIAVACLAGLYREAIDVPQLTPVHLASWQIAAILLAAALLPFAGLWVARWADAGRLITVLMTMTFGAMGMAILSPRFGAIYGFLVGCVCCFTAFGARRIFDLLVKIGLRAAPLCLLAFFAPGLARRIMIDGGSLSWTGKWLFAGAAVTLVPLLVMASRGWLPETSTRPRKAIVGTSVFVCGMVALSVTLLSGWHGEMFRRVRALEPKTSTAVSRNLMWSNQLLDTAYHRPSKLIDSLQNSHAFWRSNWLHGLVTATPTPRWNSPIELCDPSPVDMRTIDLLKISLGELPDYRLADATLATLSDDGQRSVANALHMTGSRLAYEQRFLAAIAIYEKLAEALRRRPEISGHCQLHDIEFSLGELHTYLRNHDTAERYLQAYVRQEMHAMNRNAHAVSEALVHIAGIRLNQERYAEAERLCRQSLCFSQEDSHRPWTHFECQSVLGAALVHQAELAEAESALLQGYRGLVREAVWIPARVRKDYLDGAADRLATFYERQQRPVDADQ